MKYTIKIIAVLFLYCGLITMTRQASAQPISASLQVFYDQLSPYGQWVNYPQYGYAWIPSLDETFMPYASDGHWILTDFGWTWISDYDWGWAAFHYGRWYYDYYYGWIWIPDTMWAPAWVAWRQSSSYFGWAPLGPGINVSASFGNYNVPAEQWVFVRSDDIVRPDVDRYYIDRAENVTIVKNTTVIKDTYVDKSRNVTYIAGPDKNEVQKFTGRPVKVVPIEESNQPAQKVNNDKLVLYKPQVQKVENDNKPAPAKVIALKDVKQRTFQPKNADMIENNIKSNQQRQVSPLNSSDNKKAISNQQQQRRPQNTNPPSYNKPNSQPQKKPPATIPESNKQKPAPQQVKPRPTPQSMPEQKPKPKPIPQKTKPATP